MFWHGELASRHPPSCSQAYGSPQVGTLSFALCNGPVSMDLGEEIGEEQGSCASALFMTHGRRTSSLDVSNFPLSLVFSPALNMGVRSSPSRFHLWLGPADHVIAWGWAHEHGAVIVSQFSDLGVHGGVMAVC